MNDTTMIRFAGTREQAHAALSQIRLKQVLHYDPETGMFTRVAKPAAKVGSINTCGYLQIRVDGPKYLAHRLAFLYMSGRWPDLTVDHKRGDKMDNRWSQIRPLTHSENLQNLHCARSDNACGFLGVHLFQGKYQAQIRANGKAVYLGRFATPELAHAAYLTAKVALHPTSMTALDAAP